jgi:hypothetical protein
MLGEERVRGYRLRSNRCVGRVLKKLLGWVGENRDFFSSLSLLAEGFGQ